MAPERPSQEVLPGEARPAASPRRFLPACLLVAAIVLASLPVVAGVTERISGDWQPQGDDAAIAWLSRDVLTTDSPLLGMPSTIGADEGSRAHHWGPLLFWVLAVPQRLFSNDPTGLQVGLLALEMCAIAGIVVFTRRRIGNMGALALLVLLGAATWSLGREVLSSIWNPDIALLPLAFLFVLAWSCADGDRLALPLAALTASFVAQCNLLYTPLVAALVIWAIAGFVLTHREARRLDGAGADSRLRPTLLATGLVTLACWGTAIFEEITTRPGNIEEVLRGAAREGGEHLGLLRTTYVLERTIGLVPFWTHPLRSWTDRLGLITPPPVLTATTSAVAAAVLVGGFAWAWRRQPAERALLGTAIFGLGGTAILVMRLPLAFSLAPYRMRSVWITGVFASFALVVFLVRAVSRSLVSSGRREIIVGAVRPACAFLATLFVVLVALGAGSPRRSITHVDSSQIISRLARSARDNLPSDGPYLAVLRTNPLSGISMGVLWGLERRGLDIRVSWQSAPAAAPYLADAHAPDRADLPRLYLVDHASGYSPPPEHRLVARNDGSTPDQTRALAGARSDLCGALEDDPPPITENGRALLGAASPDPSTAALSHYAAGGTPCALMDHPLLLLSPAESRAVTLSRAQWNATAEVVAAEVVLDAQDFAIYLAPPGDIS